ncbi:acetyltransferase [Bifidobacterium sp. DSM 109958]|uniref:Acetyltransferase n=1 Tax=Bifidobacterium moraviense TaxID=2675323 RepID=A0A7Y0F005_9BIFI|nr:GNAT family N-acetyltransferase [Bifidobacterium sp. DSM 109958]NMM99492.1 acetyltransferase [Bifidobacterium sp. DSM 109958]
MSVTIETERLLLRPWKTGDMAEAESLFRCASDPEIGPLCGWPPHETPEESMAVIRDVFASSANWAIAVRGGAAAATGETGGDAPVGCIDLKPLRHIDGDLASDAAFGERYGRYLGGNALEVGYWIGRPFWGRGYATEALRAVLAYAFETLRVDAVWGAHYTENARSGHVMDRCGMTAAGESHHNYFSLIDEYHDETLHVVTADEWWRERGAASGVGSVIPR